MVDLDKIIQGKRACSKVGGCRSCPYVREAHCCQRLGEDIEQLCALAERDAPAWVPVTVDTPKDDKEYLIVTQTKTGRQNINKAWYDGKSWHGIGTHAAVTHWKPTPSLPERIQL